MNRSRVVLLLLLVVGFFIVATIERSEKPQISDPTFNVDDLSKEQKAQEVFPDKIYKAPNGKQEIIAHDFFGAGEVILRENDKEEILGRWDRPADIQWTSDSSKISIMSGGPSAGMEVSIVNINTREHVYVRAYDSFVRSAEVSGINLTHVYTSNVAWYDDESLIVAISGYEDPNHPTKVQYYLINANTGNVVKRLL